MIIICLQTPFPCLLAAGAAPPITITDGKPQMVAPTQRNPLDPQGVASGSVLFICSQTGLDFETYMMYVLPFQPLTEEEFTMRNAMIAHAVDPRPITANCLR